VLRNVRSNWTLVVCNLLVVFVLAPYSIRTLGATQYGIWVLITAATAYLNTLALGVPTTSIQLLAAYSAEKRYDILNRTASSVAGMYLLVGLASVVLGGIAFVVFDGAYSVHGAVRGPMRIGFAIVVVNIALSFIGQLPYSIMAANNDFVLRNRIQIASLGLRLGLTWWLLRVSPTFVWLAVVLLICTVFEFATATVLIRRRYPYLRIRLAEVDWTIVRQVFRFSLYIVVLQVGSRLIYDSDSLVIGALLPVSDVARFAIAGSLAVYLTEFMRGISQVVLPTAARMQAQGQLDKLRDVYLKWSKISVLLSIAFCSYLLVLGPRFIGWWIGPEFEETTGRVLQILMLGYLAFLPIRAVAIPLLMGVGKPRTAALGMIATGVVNVLLSIALAKPLGLVGIAIGTTVPNLVFVLVVVQLANAEVGVSTAEYLNYVVWRPLVAAIPVFALLLFFRDIANVHGFVGLALAGIASVALGGILALLFTYRGDPRVNAEGRVREALRLRIY
jgi:O-antigen/teichoic acid export membrane protein